MNGALAAIVDWNALGEVVLYSLTATIGVGLAFGLAVRGATRTAEIRREGHQSGAVAYGVVAVTGTLVSLAAVGYGIYLLTVK